MSDDYSRPKIVNRALQCFKLAEAAEADQRKRELEDLQFQVPELQWPDEVKRSRQAASVNGIPVPARPMLSIPKLDQPVQLVLNQERAAQLGITVHPLNEDADDDTAEVLQGLYRRIEVDSRANLARSWAFERAVKAGRGWYRIITEPDPNSTNTTDQRIVIKRVLDQGKVYADPFAQEPDWSDGEWLLYVDDMPWQVYKRRFKDKSKLVGYTDQDFSGLLSEAPGWVGGTDEESRTIRVAEYFYVEYDGDEDGNGRSVRWCLVNAFEELDSRDLQCRYIPWVPVIGRELIPFGGVRRWTGIVGPNKDAQRLFNYAASGSVEMSALETKASHAIDPEAIEGFEEWWQQKNQRNFPYLPYKRFIGGRDLGEPVPIQADMSKMQMNAILLQQAGDFIHAGTGAFEPTLGQESTRAKSGRAILSLQQQHDEGNSNWLDNLVEISLVHEARIVLDLIPSYYDRPGRVARILDAEDNPQTVILNQPFTMQQGRPMAVQGDQITLGGEVKHYDLAKGRYGVTASAGKSYKSRVDQGQDQLSQLFQAEPQLFPILGDIWLKFTDFPGHIEASERIKKMLPPPLQDQNEQNQQQQAAQLKAQVEQLGTQLKQAMDYIQKEQAKYQATIAGKTIDAKTQIARAVMDNATKLAVARITAAKATLDSVREGQEEALALGQQHAFDAHQAAQDRAHELTLAEREHQQALEQAQQDHQHAVEQAAQGGQIDAALADQGHQQALEQGDQQIGGQLAVQDNAPQPEAGGSQ